MTVTTVNKQNTISLSIRLLLLIQEEEKEQEEPVLPPAHRTVYKGKSKPAGKGKSVNKTQVYYFQVLQIPM